MRGKKQTTHAATRVVDGTVSSSGRTMLDGPLARNFCSDRAVLYADPRTGVMLKTVDNVDHA